MASPAWAGNMGLPVRRSPARALLVGVRGNAGAPRVFVRANARDSDASRDYGARTMSTRLRRLLLVATSIGSLCVAVEGTARACEPSPCSGGVFLSGDLTIPPNAPGVPFWPSSGMVTEPVRVERQDGATWTKLPAELASDAERSLLLVAAPKGKRAWTAGKTYRLSPNAPCPYQKPWAGRKGPLLVTVGAVDVPLPTGKSLALKASPAAHGTLRVMTWHGSCSREVTATSIDLAAELPPEAQPWAALLVWTTEVDGRLWHPSDSLPDAVPPGLSWTGRGQDRVYTICDKDAESGLKPGRHVVVMSARVAGTSVAMASKALAIDLSCP